MSNSFSGPITGGTSITIDGNSFTKNTTSVALGTTLVSNFMFISSEQIQIITPPVNTAGTKDIIVTTNGISIIIKNGFT